MVTSGHENPHKSADQDQLVAASQQFLSDLDEQDQIRQRREEGQAIADIVEGLGLPSSVIAAVYVYPLLRDGFLSKARLESSDIAELTGIVQGLVQLGSFRLPPNWQPGEALAVQQSEALRKMLLAVVSAQTPLVKQLSTSLLSSFLKAMYDLVLDQFCSNGL